MVSRKDSNLQRKKRHARVRAKISGTASRPRLCVYRSLANIYAQVIDDTTGNTLVSASSVEKDFGVYGGNKDAAKKVGELVAKRHLTGDHRKRVRQILPQLFIRADYLCHWLKLV